jgi:hypothetical protein
MFFCGCGTTIQQSEIFKRDSIYKNWDHLKYSWFGYKNPTKEMTKMSEEQGWWGISISEK